MSWHTECVCEYYHVNIAIIDGAQAFLELHGINNDIRPFIYCPYCGKRLKRIDNKTGKEWIDERQLKLTL